MSSITGTSAIGKALDNISASTVVRLIRLGLLKASKTPGRGKTTPWRCDRSEIARFREAMRSGEIANISKQRSKPLTKRKTKLQREAEFAKGMADYLTKTGFRTLGDALAFYAGNAAPPRSEGMIELKNIEDKEGLKNER